MAEGLTDEALQELVDDYKKRQKESSGDALHKLREGKCVAHVIHMYCEVLVTIMY